MRNLSKWLDNFTNEMLHNFPDNICCIGLQGSYGRGEVSADSDLDLVIIFKSFSMEVLQEFCFCVWVMIISCTVLSAALQY